MPGQVVQIAAHGVSRDLEDPGELGNRRLGVLAHVLRQVGPASGGQ
jgi:hypothetical protein